jgi:hypothetical protein
MTVDKDDHVVQDDDELPGETRKVPGSCEESWHLGSTGQQSDNLINKKMQ